MGNIYLVGFMGTGKTTVARELAKRQKRKFVDLDDLIESREKRRISDIFAKQGEPYFRKIEKETLKETSKQDDVIVACGGGIIIDSDNIQIMKQTGRIICLTAEPKVILKRVSGTSKRPLLNVPEPEKQIQVLLKKRAICYAQADETIDTTDVSVQETVEKIINKIGGGDN